MGVRKVYLARVVGDLPPSLTLTPSAPPPLRATPGEASLLAEVRVAEGLVAGVDGRPSVLVDAPLAWVGRKGCAAVGGAGAKPSTTTVAWLATLHDGTHLMHCQPHTGHRHQIRCHLASLGLPIANDRLYGGTFARPCCPPMLPPSFTDDEAGTLHAALGPGAAHFRAWCPRCTWTAEQLQHERTPPEVDATDIWLRSWRYTIPALGIDVASPWPLWVSDKPVELLGTELEGNSKDAP